MPLELLNELIEFFARDEEEPNFQLVYIFGSRVSGRVGPQSDYDFAILFLKEPESGRICALKHRIAEFLASDQVDLVVLNRAPVELRYNIVASGSLLYKKSASVFIEFEADTLSLYFDLLPVLRRHRKELVEDQYHETGVRRYRNALGKTQELLAQIRTSRDAKAG